MPEHHALADSFFCQVAMGNRFRGNSVLLHTLISKPFSYANVDLLLHGDYTSFAV
jgi:hypothetical protein